MKVFNRIALLLVSLLVGGCFFAETPVSHYATLSAAIRDRAIERGWLPAGLPASSVNIFEQHDLDTNHGIAALSARTEELEHFSAHLEVIPNDEIATIAPCFKATQDWWPEALQNGSLQSLLDVGYTFHRKRIAPSPSHEERTWHFAIHSRAGTMYAWH